MAIKTRTTFAYKSYKKAVLANAVAEQTKRLLAYAEEELFEMIASREFKSRTFNLADSYVWAVYYNKKEQGHGYIGAKKAQEKSILHEWGSKDKQVPVDGREEATKFLNEFKSSKAIENGWTIVWAACAPYSVYLDPAAGSTKSNRFFVISQRYDHIKSMLEPKCKVEFLTSL